MHLKYWLGADDALDVFAVHAVGGFIGELLTGVFATDYIAHLDGETVIKGGWLNRNWYQLAIQLANAVATLAWSFTLTFCLLMFMRLLGKFIPALKLRVDEDQEEQGVDDVEIGEFAYDYVERKREVSVTIEHTGSQHTQSVDDFGHLTIIEPRPEKEIITYEKEIPRSISE